MKLGPRYEHLRCRPGCLACRAGLAAACSDCGEVHLPARACGGPLAREAIVFSQLRFRGWLQQLGRWAGRA